MQIFVEITAVIIIATFLAGIMKLLKQPIIMGYILTGIIAGPIFLGVVNDPHTLETFAKIGISILLFIVGLGLSPKVIAEVGKVAFVTGLGQIIFTVIGGVLISLLLGYNFVESLFIAIALTFSSTIIILKLISDKKDLQKLYAKISVGFLLVQDLVATLILVVVATVGSSQGQSISTVLFSTTIKGFALGVVIYLISLFLLPKIIGFFAESQEFLFLFSIGWGLGLGTLFHYLGFSIEIGALVAGISLSVSTYSTEISSKLKPLRDFFIIMFFVVLGLEMSFDNLQTLLAQAAVYSIFVLIGNPIIVMVLMGILGYNKKVGFLCGLAVAQISEFSLILMLLAYEYGYVTQGALSMVTFVGLITIAGSSYLIIYADPLYQLLAPYLSIFEKKRTLKEKDIDQSYEVVLFGCNRVGYDFIKIFEHLKEKFLVVDFDPKTIKTLNEQGIKCIYGDAEDIEFLEELNLGTSHMIVSTIPDFETNLFLTSFVHNLKADVIVIVISYDINHALRLYNEGASYVILPHFIGGHFAAMLAAKHWFNIDRFESERDKHIKYLRERLDLGHLHPREVK